MIINGKIIAETIFNDIKKDVESLKRKGVVPKIVIISVGKDDTWKTYVKIKSKRAKELNIELEHINIDNNQEKLLETIQWINTRDNIQGFIVQRPLPENINKEIITNEIDPKKDIDGFRKDSKFESTVWLAVKTILVKIHKHKHLPGDRMDSGKVEMEFEEWLKIKNIVVVGKGETAGKPTIEGLKKLGINPNIIDSKTQNRKEIFKNADIIISAAGKSRAVEAKDLKQGVILIGIGMHKENNEIIGDYNEEEIKNIASYYTTTPGGIGPLNLAYLFKNLIQSAKTIQ
ncbi:bifunctional 5,10-methylenetetrahydrofolate dehydrogenase/5,10-methenyltetrahydrofolate cyclohydrolase [Candidatus Parcubacteria bacterium]|nr:MAG: bifunctional 5,10-methylenetetrahydrofolate dehydrogenase/5,10-methenyltetrahydrofolate cyclohydrolase [Candidatus Parcubacteria bacterium]